jgi:hypothetical protein
MVDDRRRERVLLVVLALVPVCFVQGSFLGFQWTGWAWIAGVAITAPLAFLQPVAHRVLLRITPYLAFLGLATFSLAWSPDLGRGVPTLVQLVVPVPAYLLASRLADPRGFLVRAARVATAGVLLAGVLSVLERAGVLVGPVALSPRPMAVALVPLLVIATVESSRRATLLLGLVAVGSAVLTGGRTASAVLLVVFVLSPAWRVSWRGRTALFLIALVSVVAYSRTDAFQERFFFGTGGTLTDALTGSGSLNTAGRRELWPPVYERCSTAPWLGRGLGTGSAYAGEFSFDVLHEPHNEYLRTFCDVGIVGLVPFWGGFLAAGFAGLLLARRRLRIGAGLGQVVVGLLLLSVTDNPLVYTAHFMVPLAVVLGVAAAAGERPHHRSR